MAAPNYYEIGEPVVLEATFGQPPNTVVATVVKPDGTASTPTVDSSRAPIYTVTVVATDAGTWGYRFEGSGGYTGVEEGYFVVQPSGVLSGVPAYTYDPATAIGKVRLYTDDRDLSQVGNDVALALRSAVWSDAELQVFLDNNEASPLLAAADALTVLAANRQLLVQSRRIGQTTVNFGSVRADLLAQAKAYRDQAYALGEGTGTGAPAMEYAEVAYNDFGARQIIFNDMLRNG
jgi:hypothetical protein